MQMQVHLKSQVDLYIVLMCCLHPKSSPMMQFKRSKREWSSLFTISISIQFHKTRYDVIKHDSNVVESSARLL